MNMVVSLVVIGEALSQKDILAVKKNIPKAVKLNDVKFIHSTEI